MAAEEKIKKARIDLILKQPFFASLIMKLEDVEDPTCPTAWTNGKKMGYNPKFIEALTQAETLGVTAHEVLHCVFDHIGRRDSRDMKKWNRAADYVINLVLLSIKDKNGNQIFQLPKGCLYDEQYKDMSAEEVYSLLPDEPTNGNPKPKDDEEKEEGNEGEGNEGEGNEGEGNEGEGNEGEGNDPGKCGEVRDSDDSTETANDWKVATQQAANIASKAGNLPGELKRFVEELLDPKVSWKQLLRRFIETSANNDYTWTVPNRRYTSHGIYLPSLKSEHLDLVVSIDTSMSTSAYVDQFVNEIMAIGREFNAEITVMCVDTKVHSVQTFNSQTDEIKIELKGFGGTRFAPAFKKVDELGLNPKCLVYLTDLECRDFGPAPDYPVLWVAPKSNYAGTPPFGEVVNM